MVNDMTAERNFFDRNMTSQLEWLAKLLELGVQLRAFTCVDWRDSPYWYAWHAHFRRHIRAVVDDAIVDAWNRERLRSYVAPSSQ